MATPRHASAKSLLLAVASTLLTLGVLEVGFRAWAYRQDGRRQEAALRRRNGWREATGCARSVSWPLPDSPMRCMTATPT